MLKLWCSTHLLGVTYQFHVLGLSVILLHRTNKSFESFDAVSSRFVCERFNSACKRRGFRFQIVAAKMSAAMSASQGSTDVNNQPICSAISDPLRPMKSLLLFHPCLASVE